MLDKELVGYLDDLRVKGNRAAELHEKIGMRNASQSEIEERTSLANWFSNQVVVLRGKFTPFLRYKRSWWKDYAPIVIVVCVSLVLLLYLMFTNQGLAENPSPSPTAAEVFQFRSECAALGRKILDSHPQDPSIGEYQVSHYEPRTNRCYVRLDRISPEGSTSDYSRLLFDGQTGESLAFVEAKNKNKIGRVEGGGWLGKGQPIY